jgi:hypothetical protein
LVKCKKFKESSMVDFAIWPRLHNSRFGFEHPVDPPETPRTRLKPSPIPMNPTSSTRLAILALAALSVTASADTVTVPLRPVADTRIFNADWGQDLNE